MKRTTLVAALVIAPAALFAQANVQTNTQANVQANARVDAGAQGSAASPSSRLSADAQSQVEANIKVARERRLPEEPIRKRVAEGQAKGASEAQVVAASKRTLVDLQTSHDAMVRGGHAQPSDDEVARGAQLVASGYTSAQIEAVAQHSAPERSLVTAFEVLTSLKAQGKSTTGAVTQVESQLAARVSDTQLRSLVTTSGNVSLAGGVTGAVNGVTGGQAAASGSAATAGSAAAGAGSAAAAAGQIGGAVSGTVSGALGGTVTRKP